MLVNLIKKGTQVSRHLPITKGQLQDYFLWELSVDCAFPQLNNEQRVFLNSGLIVNSNPNYLKGIIS